MRALRWASQLWMLVLALIVLLAATMLGAGLILSRTAPAPSLTTSSPLDGISEVSTRIQPTLHFSEPMNPRTVERAIHIQPPISAHLIWDSNNRSPIIVPMENLQADTTYNIIIDTQARSRQLVPLKEPVSITFHTAPAPAVLTFIPASESKNVPVTAPLLLQFSRPMVSPNEQGQSQAFPELQISPATPGNVSWISPSIAIFRPDLPLAAATRYTINLDAALSDQQGETLGRDYSWTFTTALPTVMGFGPQNTSRSIAHTAVLTMTLSQPLPLPEISRLFSITPAMSGTYASEQLPNGSQIISFTPELGWQPGTNYTASFAGQLHGLELNAARWSFETAPTPALIGRYPGEGQILPAGQDIRLIFNTPMSAQALQNALSIDPPAGEIKVTSLGSEVRVSAELRAATAYTLTLSAIPQDANATTFAQTQSIHFRTAPASPELSIMHSDPTLVQFSPEQPANLKLNLTNISSLLLSLYDLDEATLVRAAGFDASDWKLFQPERYNRPLRRSWTEVLSLTLNTTNDYELPLMNADGSALAPGAYYLRLRSPDGPSAHVIILISNTRLTLQLSPHAGLVWATNVLSNSLATDLPIAIYQDDALVLESNTNSQGLLNFTPVGGAAHRYTILARGKQPALIRSEKLTLALQTGRRSYRATLLTDSGTYTAGETIQLGGFVRQVITETLSYALEDTPVTLRLTNGKDLQTPMPGSQTLSTRLQAHGVISTSFPLDRDLPPGRYTLSADIAGQFFSLPIQINPSADPNLRVSVELAARPDNPRKLPARIRLTDAAGLPIAQQPLSWTLRIEPAYPALPAGFAHSLPAPTNAGTLTGSAITNADGYADLELKLADPKSMLLRYRLQAELQSSQGRRSAEALVVPENNASYIAIQAEHQLISPQEQLNIDLLTIDQFGTPRPRIPLRFVIVRILKDREQVVFERSLTSDQQGQAQLKTRLPGGRYQLRAWATNPDQQLISRSPVQVIQPGSVSPDSNAVIVDDQPVYQTGESIRLLANGSSEKQLALTTSVSLSDHSAQVRALNPGEIITYTLTRADLPQITVHSLILNNNPGRSAQIFEQSIDLHDPTEALSLTIATAQTSYLPGSTATISVTAYTSAGIPSAADLIVALVDAAEDPPAQAYYSAAQQQGLRSYVQPDAVIRQITQQTEAQPGPKTFLWRTGLRTNAQGQATLKLPISTETANLRVVIWAANAQAIGQASLKLTVDRSSQLRTKLPGFVRPGDQLWLSAQADALDMRQPFSVTLGTKSALLETGPISQTISNEQQASWQIRILAGAELGLELRDSSKNTIIMSTTRTIIPQAPDIAGQSGHDHGVFLLRSYLDPDTGQTLDPKQLKPGQLIQIRLNIVTLQTLQDVSISEPFAAGLSSPSIEQSAPFSLLKMTPDHLELRAAMLAPGIYEYSYQQRVLIPGIYTQPAPQLSSNLEVIPIQSTASTLTINK